MNTGDLVHRFLRRFLRRQAFFAHQAFDVFHHHDGVIHQQANGQHHREHRQHVDGEAQHAQHREGAQQHHRIGDREQRRDDRYLFLETLMSARERLHLSWIGEGVGDGQPRNPAAPLAELMAMLERADGIADTRLPAVEAMDVDADEAEAPPTHASTHAWRIAHPLQPFDTRYFDGRDIRLYTFDESQVPLHKPQVAVDQPAISTSANDTPSTFPERLLLRDLITYFRDPGP